jgi:hypothetical protein
VNDRLATYALNAGIVHHIEAALPTIRGTSGEDVAAALAKLMQAVLDSTELAPAAKHAALGQMDYLAAQAAEPAPKRQRAAGELAIDGLKAILAVAKGVTTIWAAVEPTLRKITTVDLEQLRRDLSDALKALQQDHEVTGLDFLAAQLTTLQGSPYAFHGRLIQKNLSVVPRPHGALMWSLTQVVAKLEGR